MYLPRPMTKQPTSLGAFSVSLAVKDLEASRAFYEKLGFEMAGGEPAQNWVILRNGSVTIGLPPSGRSPRARHCRPCCGGGGAAAGS